MKKHTKTIVAGLMASILFIPTVADARVVSTPRVSTPRVSTPRVSTPRVSTPKVSTPKTTTTKPSSIKSGTSTMKPTNKGTTVPRVNKNTTKNNSSKTTTKVDSGNYSVKKKPSTTPVAPVTNNYYNDYSTSRLGYRSNLGFWQYYGLTHMMNDDVSERDIAKELTKKGYSKTEINKILKDANKEQKTKKKKKSGIFKVLGIVAILAVIVFILL